MDTVKRLNADEFKDDDKETVQRIAELYNYFAEQTTNIINGNIDFDNMNRELRQIDVVVDANGTPNITTQFSATVGMRGTNVLRVVNLTNTGTYPTGNPLISFTASGSGLYTIDNITGLVAGNEFRLTFELVF